MLLQWFQKNSFACLSVTVRLVHYFTTLLENWELLTRPKNCCKFPFSMTLSNINGSEERALSEFLDWFTTDRSGHRLVHE